MVYGIFEAWFVESCPACGGPSDGGFCSVCSAEFARVPRACGRCGLARPVARCPLAVCAAELVRIENACPRCGLRAPVARCPRRRAPWHVEAVQAPFAYAPPLDHYLHALKYRGARGLGRAFGALIAPALRAPSAKIDALVAVPLHRARLRERGYNQALEIARALSRELGVPVLERGIARRMPTRKQAGLRKRERLAAMTQAFRVRRALDGLNVAIVDDVVTTGATVNALAAALRAAGARSCVAFAVARTPERRAVLQPRNV
jgi:ComF family protein